MKTKILITRIDASGRKHVKEAQLGGGREYTITAGGNRFHLNWRDPGLKGEHVEIVGEQNVPPQKLRGAGPGVEFKVGGETYRFSTATAAVEPPKEPLLLYLGAAIAIHVLIYGVAKTFELRSRRMVAVEAKGLEVVRVNQLLKKMGRSQAKSMPSPPKARPSAKGNPAPAPNPSVRTARAARDIEKSKPVIPSRRPTTQPSTSRPPAAVSKQNGTGGTGRSRKGFGGLDIAGMGGISRSGVIAALTAHLTPLQACYQAALSRDASLQGTVLLKWVVSERGNVGAVQVVRSDISNMGLQKCVTGEIRRIRFPKPKGGAVAITFPLAFSPRRF